MYLDNEATVNIQQFQLSKINKARQLIRIATKVLYIAGLVEPVKF